MLSQNNQLSSYVNDFSYDVSIKILDLCILTKYSNFLAISMTYPMMLALEFVSFSKCELNFLYFFLLPNVENDSYKCEVYVLAILYIHIWPSSCSKLWKCTKSRLNTAHTMD